MCMNSPFSFFKSFTRNNPLVISLPLTLVLCSMFFLKHNAFLIMPKIKLQKSRDDIRNLWAHAVIEEWTDIKMDEALTEMERLAKMVDNNAL